MRLLLTGATGFLGSHLARALLGAGHDVAILKRSFSETRRLAEPLPRLRAYDLDRDSLDRPFREAGRFDAVIHAATCYGRKDESPAQVAEANLLFPLRLLETAGRSGTGVFFNVDSFFTREAGLCRYLGAYTLSKRQFTEWGRQLAGSTQLRFVNVRLEHVYGEDDDPSKFVPQAILHCLRGEPVLPMTPGGQQRDFTYVADVISAFVVLLDRVVRQVALPQAIDLGTGRPTTVRDFTQRMRDLCESRTVLEFGALPYRDHEIMRSVADIAPLRALGWSPRYTLQQGLSRTIAWYRQNQG